LFVVLKGRVLLCVRSENQKQAVLDIFTERDIVGKDSIAGEPVHTASTSALTDCVLLQIQKKTMMRALAREVSLSNLFCTYVLRRNVQYQQDLVDQRCNFGKKRLARILLLFAHFDGQTAEDAVIPNINHETPAEMVGTTRSRVCFFMKRLRRSAYIDYRLYTQLIRIRRSRIAFLAGPKRVASPQSVRR
jgi:CRP/FNR family transcriptional regulator, cyclic AMP receptor protein